MKENDDCQGQVAGKDNFTKDFIDIKMFIYRLKSKLLVGLEDFYLFSW